MTDDSTTAPSHVLRLARVDLVGAYRTVDLRAGLNIVRGDITTGKTTFILLLRALLGAVPRHLAPETATIRGIAANVYLGTHEWRVLRPMVTTKDSPVEVAEVLGEEPEEGVEGIALRLPAAGSGGFGEFLLQQLGVPVVYVPRARTDPTSDLSPVTINDWLNYCIVTGEELDTQVFGHRDVFRNLKRGWVFEILYGLYDSELATLNAEARLVDREIASALAERDVVARFLTEAQVGDRPMLEVNIEGERQRVAELRDRKVAFSSQARDAEPGQNIADLRIELLQLRERLDVANADVRALDAQVRDLVDLERDLTSLSKRLTRSIVADEWMVDFEFVVCPRCGQNVDQHRAERPICYLCQQPEPEQPANRDLLLKEQDRVASQITETEQLLAQRRALRLEREAQSRGLGGALRATSARLDEATSDFVSAHAAEIEALASGEAQAAANIEWMQRMLTLYARADDQDDRLATLDQRLAELNERIESHRVSVDAGEANIEALERRILEYLERLNAPSLGDLLTVKVNRRTYLPEVSTRNFDELSSQGLKTLVNVAHALAHHTVAIDRNLTLPGLLVLDGVSANSGREGLDGDRILDMYRLFVEVASEYKDRLQLVIVDNEVPEEVVQADPQSVVLTLSQEDRLIRTSWPEAPPVADDL